MNSRVLGPNLSSPLRLLPSFWSGQPITVSTRIWLPRGAHHPVFRRARYAGVTLTRGSPWAGLPSPVLVHLKPLTPGPWCQHPLRPPQLPPASLAPSDARVNRRKFSPAVEIVECAACLWP
jgi:hypothetical protein